VLRGSRLRRGLVRRGDESGFTLIELVVALFLLALLMSASLYSVMQGMKLSRDEQSRQVAANLTSAVLQSAESTALSTDGFTTLSQAVTTPVATNRSESGVTYNSVETGEWESQGQSGSVCATGTNVALILRLNVTTSWGYAGQSVQESTLLAPPNGSFSSSDGALPVLVEQSDGSGEPGATVTVIPTGSTSGSQASITTGSDGCAFFAQLPPGTYNVTVNSPTGVGIDEESTYEVDGLTINAGQLGQTIDVFYETSGYIAWSWSATNPPPASGMPISIGNPSQGLTDNMFEFASPAAMLTPVYPSTYTVFAGSCTDADPNGETSGSNPQPFYPPATYPNIAASATVTSSQIASVSVPLYPLDVQVQPSGGVSASAANSPPASDPTATAGQAGVCLGSNPTYTLSPVLSGVSDTSVGLGEMTINLSVNVASGSTTTLESGSVTVWVKPDGIYTVTNGTVSSTPVSGPVVVPVS
jgi:prepilin-type N-terminal cleavage/methylation domain-containing protein